MTSQAPASLFQRFRDWHRNLGRDLLTPAGRRRARFHYQWMDHAILRHYWHNFAEIAPGVYRSNHPTHKRLGEMKEQGIISVINLRGHGRTSPQIFEEESCETFGLNLVKVALQARDAPPRQSFLELFELFRETPKPFVMHCKSGADRAGIAAAIYLMSHEGADIDTARRQLSFRFLHIRKSATGVLDHILDIYAERLATKGPISVEDWISTEYDPDIVTQSFDKLSIWAR